MFLYVHVSVCVCVHDREWVTKRERVKAYVSYIYFESVRERTSVECIQIYVWIYICNSFRQHTLLFFFFFLHCTLPFFLYFTSILFQIYIWFIHSVSLIWLFIIEFDKIVCVHLFKFTFRYLGVRMWMSECIWVCTRIFMLKWIGYIHILFVIFMLFYCSTDSNVLSLPLRSW